MMRYIISIMLAKVMYFNSLFRQRYDSRCGSHCECEIHLTHRDVQSSWIVVVDVVRDD